MLKYRFVLDLLDLYRCVELLDLYRCVDLLDHPLSCTIEIVI